MRWKHLILFTTAFFLILVGQAMANPVPSNFLWEEAFDTHGSIMMLIRANSGQIVYANQAASDFYGYPVEQLKTMNIADINVYSPQQVEQERLAAAEQQRNHFIFPHRLANGETRTVEVHSYPIEEEGSLLLSVIHDITQRLAAQTALVESNQRLKRAEQITGLGHWEFRLTEDRAFLSEGAQKITGLDQEVTISEIHNTSDQTDRQRRREALDKLVRDGTPYNLEFQIIRDDGEIRDIHSLGEYDKESNTVFGIIHDITARAKAERSLQQARSNRFYILGVFIMLLALIIGVLVINILRRRKAEEAIKLNLIRNESLVKILQYETDSIQELLEYVLRESIKLTESSEGCICSYGTQNGEFHLHSWSDGFGKRQDSHSSQRSCLVGKSGLCKQAISQREPVILNGTAHNSVQDQEPAVKSDRYMAVPIFDGDEAVAVIGLASQTKDYDSIDAWQVGLLMNNVWSMVERKRAAHALREEKEQLKTTLLSVGDGVITTDRHGKIQIINEVAQEITGWTKEEAIGEDFDRVFPITHEQTGKRLESPVKQVLAKREIIELTGDLLLIAKDGEKRNIADSAAPIWNGEDIQGVVVVFRDVSEQKAQQQAIEYLSYYDQLTGLHNRRYFEEELKRVDTEASLPLSIVIGDLNELKLTNDTFGHQLGDALLKKAAEIIEKSCRKSDIVARWGGDEFAVLLPNTARSEAEGLVNRIEEEIEGVSVGSVHLSISIGWSTKNSADQTMKDVFDEAERHMYRTKLFKSSSIRQDTIQAIMNALFEKNQREKTHANNVSKLSGVIGQALGLSKREIQELGLIGRFHDIGKVSTNEHILNKPAKLSPEEYGEIKRHSEVGYRLLNSVKDMEEIAEYVLFHHERWDGTGYPKGLKGEEIPLQSRITAVADAFAAMTSSSPYRKALSIEEAKGELEKKAGTQFDPRVVVAFLEADEASQQIASSAEE